MSQVQAVVPQVEAMIPKFVAMILQFVAMIPQVVAMAPQVEAFAKFIVSLNSSSDTHPQEMADAHHPRHGDPQSLGRARHRRLGRSHPVELRRDHLVADRHGHSDDKNNTLVTDPIAFYQLTPLKTESASSLPEISNWAAQEHEAFEKSYAAQPKQFGWIASQVKTRTPAECVIHYYRTKCENKYRNLHLPPQAIIEGKPRKLRGKRFRRAPCKTLRPDAAATNTLKPKPKTNPELPQTLGGDQPEATVLMNSRKPISMLILGNCLDSRSMQTSQANKTDSSTTTTTTTTHPSNKHLAVSRAELNKLSTRSAESNLPTIILTNQVPTAQFEPPMKPLDPHPASSTTLPPKLHEQQPPIHH
ncbi:hypothetical protein PCANC_19182 [Puccinia coronata f. sp. avenae]|uniref:SANT domain-containing protein n=1 Tax=Puccinia coronata f. sp. avenae TaxID=200324 RepID=A0A2N5U2I8_9BASI|nr:hypothetical protein PCANC_19182 [Puccinia coronata f. sp. avenae]